MSDEGTVTTWVGELRRGNMEAARRLWERYFGELLRVARARLPRHFRRASDEEDVAISAFDSFIQGVARGAMPNVCDREDLWRMLVLITARKVCDAMKREGRQKRGGGRARGQATLGPGDEDDGPGLEAVIGREPDPAFVAQFADECDRLLTLLPDETMRNVVRLKLQGHTNKEIAGQLDCAEATVYRKLERIRKTWEKEMPR